MKKKFLLTLLNFYCISSNIIAQTSEIGNYEVYTREYLTSSIGYLKTQFYLYGKDNFQHGISYNHYYDISTIGLIPIDEYSSQLGFFLTGAYRLGATTGENINPETNEQNRFYVGNLDLFSLYLTSDFTYIIDRSYSLTVRLDINLVNVGGLLAFQDKQKFNETYMASINFIPLSFSLSIFFDFGRSGLGLLFYFNTLNILQYDIIAKNLTEVSTGLKSMDVLIKKYDFQIMFTF